LNVLPLAFKKCFSNKVAAGSKKMEKALQANQFSVAGTIKELKLRYL